MNMSIHISSRLPVFIIPLALFLHNASAQPQQDQDMCKYAAQHMIEVARQSLSQKSSRPERIEKRRQLVEDWTSRMEKGEDPCVVYEDIQKAAATF